MCFDVARGLASRLRLKLIIGDDIGTIKRSRQGIGFASAIETHITQEVYIQARNGVARGLASRLRLKLFMFVSLSNRYSKVARGLASRLRLKLYVWAG